MNADNLLQYAVDTFDAEDQGDRFTAQDSLGSVHFWIEGKRFFVHDERSDGLPCLVSTYGELRRSLMPLRPTQAQELIGQLITPLGRLGYQAEVLRRPESQPVLRVRLDNAKPVAVAGKTYHRVRVFIYDDFRKPEVLVIRKQGDLWDNYPPVSVRSEAELSAQLSLRCLCGEEVTRLAYFGEAQQQLREAQRKLTAAQQRHAEAQARFTQHRVGGTFA